MSLLNYKIPEVPEGYRSMLISTAVSMGIQGASMLLKMYRNRVKGNTVLEFVLNADTKIVEHADKPLWGNWPGTQPPLSLFDIVECLDIARKDKSVTGLVLYIDPAFTIGTGHLWELSQAIKEFSSAGKKTFAFVETLFEAGNVLVPYTLATACDTIITPNYAGVALAAPLPGAFFLKKTLEKLSIEEELTKRREYKNAANIVQEENLTDAHREAITTLTNELLSILYAEIGKNRGMSADQVKDIIHNQGPIVTAEKAKELKLVDDFAYPDQFYGDVLNNAFGKKHTLLFLRTYLTRRVGRRLVSNKKGKKSVALIFAEGSIHRGKSRTNSEGGNTIGSSTLCAAIRDARKDKVNAIVLRVNSGGGSAAASDMIARELIKAQEDSIKVVVSMSNVAASGGYMISMMADRIVANSVSLTGSIGVVWGKMNYRKFWEWLGITWDFCAHDDNATYYSSILPYGTKNRVLMEGATDHIYDMFKASVGKFRKIDNDKMEELARGRVYDGATALQHNLITDEGGLLTSLTIAKEELGLKPTDKVKVKEFPKALSVLDKFMKKATNSQQPGYMQLTCCHGGLLGACSRFSSNILHANQLVDTVLKVPGMQPALEHVQNLAAATNEPAAVAPMTQQCLGL